MTNAASALTFRPAGAREPRKSRTKGSGTLPGAPGARSASLAGPRGHGGEATTAGSSCRVAWALIPASTRPGRSRRPCDQAPMELSSSSQITGPSVSQVLGVASRILVPAVQGQRGAAVDPPVRSASFRPPATPAAVRRRAEWGELLLRARGRPRDGVAVDEEPITFAAPGGGLEGRRGHRTPTIARVPNNAPPLQLSGVRSSANGQTLMAAPAPHVARTRARRPGGVALKAVISTIYLAAMPSAERRDLGVNGSGWPWCW